MEYDINKLADIAAKGIEAAKVTSSPIMNSPEVSNYMAPQLYQSSLEPRNKAEEYNLSARVYNQKLEAQRKLQEEQDMLDPTKYIMRLKEDGGYDFYDPKGNQIDIATYSKATNQRPVDIVKDSQNPIDIQYAQDWTGLQKYVQAILDGDKTTITEMQTQDPELKQYSGKGDLDKLMQRFKQHYQRYYVPRTQNPNAWGARPGGMMFPAGDSGAGGSLGDLLASYGIEGE